eukprot:357725-Chlamydomonas_euryale.AAC.3
MNSPEEQPADFCHVALEHGLSPYMCLSTRKKQKVARPAQLKHNYQTGADRCNRAGFGRVRAKWGRMKGVVNNLYALRFGFAYEPQTENTAKCGEASSAKPVGHHASSRAVRALY